MYNSDQVKLGVTDSLKGTHKVKWCEPRLEITCSYSSDEEGGYGWLIDKHYGKILVRDEAEWLGDEEEVPEYVAGDISAQMVCLSQASIEGAPYYGVIDHSQVVMDCCEPLLDSSDDFSAPVKNVLGEDFWSSNILIITELSIRPKFRGTRLGLWAMSVAMTKLATYAGLVVIKPLPLQFDEYTLEDSKRVAELGLQKFSKDKRFATKKLRDYYKLLGFKRLPKTPLMILSPACGWTTLDALGLR